MGGSAEETVMALLDFLVDPLLPSRSSMRETISPSQEELVAKQVDHPLVVTSFVLIYVFVSTIILLGLVVFFVYFCLVN